MANSPHFKPGHWTFGAFFDDILRLHKDSFHSEFDHISSTYPLLPDWSFSRPHIFSALFKLQAFYIPELTKVTKTFLPFRPHDVIPTGGESIFDFERRFHFISVAYFNAVCDAIESNFPAYLDDSNVLFIVARELPRIRALLKAIQLIVWDDIYLPASHYTSPSTEFLRNAEYHNADSRKFVDLEQLAATIRVLGGWEMAKRTVEKHFDPAKDSGVPTTLNQVNVSYSDSDPAPVPYGSEPIVRPAGSCNSELNSSNCEKKEDSNHEIIEDNDDFDSYDREIQTIISSSSPDSAFPASIISSPFRSSDSGRSSVSCTESEIGLVQMTFSSCLVPIKIMKREEIRKCEESTYTVDKEINSIFHVMSKIDSPVVPSLWEFTAESTHTGILIEIDDSRCVHEIIEEIKKEERKSSDPIASIIAEMDNDFEIDVARIFKTLH